MYFMMYMIISNKTPIFRYCVLLGGKGNFATNLKT